MTTETPTPDSPAPKARRRAAAIGVSAGLLGGTLAGMAFGVPGLTSAAANDPAAATAALAQQTEDDGTTETTDERPQIGIRMREAIQPLVDDGTLTADQADAVVAQLIDAAPDREERRENRAERREARQERRQAPEAVQELLGLSPEEIREQLRAGSTLGEIATAQGVDPQAVVDAIVTELTERVDAAVAEGRIDAEEAAEKLDGAEERISDRVNNGRPDRGASADD
jgi:polyhydroxyalkanoate synthesis regulator phasin